MKKVLNTLTKSLASCFGEIIGSIRRATDMVLLDLSIDKMLLFMQMQHRLVMSLYVILNAQLVAFHDIIIPTKTNNGSN